MQFETDRGALGTAVISQISAGRKNRLWLELDGADEALAFDQENPETLWRGRREATTILRRDPEHLSPAAARLATLPPGHPEGYAQCFDRFVEDVYAAIAGGDAPDGLPVFADGLRAAPITDAVLASAREERWVDVPAVAARRWRAMSGTSPILEVRGLVKHYPGAKALDGVDFDVRPGEVHCLLGPNGAGKSTLIKCVSGVVEPTAGEVLVDGEPLPTGEPSASLARGVATIYQELDLVEDLRVYESDLPRPRAAPRRRCSTATR